MRMSPELVKKKKKKVCRVEPEYVLVVDEAGDSPEDDFR